MAETDEENTQAAEEAEMLGILEEAESDENSELSTNVPDGPMDNTQRELYAKSGVMPQASWYKGRLSRMAFPRVQPLARTYVDLNKVMFAIEQLNTLIPPTPAKLLNAKSIVKSLMELPDDVKSIIKTVPTVGQAYIAVEALYKVLKHKSFWIGLSIYYGIILGLVISNIMFLMLSFKYIKDNPIDAAAFVAENAADIVTSEGCQKFITETAENTAKAGGEVLADQAGEVVSSTAQHVSNFGILLYNLAPGEDADYVDYEIDVGNWDNWDDAKKNGLQCATIFLHAGSSWINRITAENNN